MLTSFFFFFPFSRHSQGMRCSIMKVEENSSALFFAGYRKLSQFKLQAKNTAPAVFTNWSHIIFNTVL